MKLIALTQGQFAKVDDEDFDNLSRVRWCAQYSKNSDSFYAKSRSSRTLGKPKTIYLHRLIMGFPEGMKVDHKNGDTLDCQKSNLRICTNSENLMNRKGATSASKSGVRGVCWHNVAKKWRAEICINRRTKYLGLFADIEDASRVVVNARSEYFGEFAGGA